jgi:hypothetical protein
MSEHITNSEQRVHLPHGARLRLAIEVIRCSAVPLTKPQIERKAGIGPFSTERWGHFQKKYQDEIVVHPITGKVHLLGIQNRKEEHESNEMSSL